MESLSPSVPDDDVAQINGSDSSDQAFVDVEIFVIDLCSADITTAC